MTRFKNYVKIKSQNKCKPLHQARQRSEKMKRKELKTVIKAISEWKIDKRKGDYRLPNGRFLSDYLEEIGEDFLKAFNKAISIDGDIYDYIPETSAIFRPFLDNERTCQDEQRKRLQAVIFEMLN